ncbi:PREDICTED: transmembrane protein 45B-like [Tarenaya hassleriana]|uniref:transmembrane protein 45B-like n=1 Tax=Tarenaya hassleriana TaxID=28532 RepID=UPI00053C72B3|nr:PREDICTED: transmembrane protein 45B-like [Tarenaya hassleriana]
MGTLVGHVAPGFAFLALGLWHIFNHIKLFCLHPKTYTSSPWFPASKLRHLELYLIMVGSSISIAMELFIGPKKHQPFDSDGTIPSNHLHNFEHSSISMTFFAYAAFALVFDKTGPRASYGLTNLVGAIAFAQQLFLFHLHSADHMGVEGQYHLLLQFVIFVSLVTTLMGIAMPKSFLVSFVRSSSIIFQGIWFITMGYMLWTPSLIPKGCSLHLEEGHQVVRCSSHEALHRAKSLVNIEFSWSLVGITIFVMSLYLVLYRVYGQNVEYSALTTKDQTEQDREEQDIESQKLSNPSFVQMGKLFGHRDMER